MQSTQERPLHLKGHGLDSPPTPDSGRDVSGAGYVNDDAFQPPLHGESLNGAPVIQEGADISRSRYTLCDGVELSLAG